MSEDKQTKIDIPESIESYKLTLFWGLTITQIILVFIAVLFIGFGIFNVVLHRFIAMAGMFFVTALAVLGIIEIRGRNFYRHVLFIVSYYRNKPGVLIYHHYAASGAAVVQARELLASQRDDRKKTFVFVMIALVVGVLMLILISIYLYYVLHS